MKNPSLRILSALLVLYGGQVTADFISVYNMTDEDLWVATYYDTGQRADRVGPRYFLARQSSRVIDRPQRKLWVDRVMVYDHNKNVLHATYENPAWHGVNKKPIGYLSGSTFYLAKQAGIINAFTSVEWSITQPLLNAVYEVAAIVSDPLKDYIKTEEPAIRDNPYKNRKAYVREGNELSPEEVAFLKSRMPRIREALTSFLGVKIEEETKLPCIALILSGGGYRAAIASLGWLKGADKIGLLDTITYASALSGSTWALSAWYSSNLPIHAFVDRLIEKVDDGLVSISLHDIELIKHALLVKLAYNQPLSLVDIYGLLLGNALLNEFGDKRHRVYLSAHAKQVLSGNWMLPIYTAVRADKAADEYSGWFEFSPFEVGAWWLGRGDEKDGRYVPTWGFGRKYIQGVSADNAPEQTLSFLMGIFGSAFAARLDQIYETIKEEIPSNVLKIALAQIMVNQLGEERIGYAEINNFIAGMRSLENEENLIMVDAGATPGFNLPYPPVSGHRPGRKADILIFMDASETVEKGAELKKVEAYARAHNLKFPTIDYEKIGTNAVTFFKDENDAEVPLVIYMPLVNDPSLSCALKRSEFAEYRLLIKNFDVEKCMKEGDCSTLNFRYDLAEARRLSTLIEFHVVANQHLLQNAIRAHINRS